MGVENVENQTQKSLISGVVVRAEDLPLHCPVDEESAWSSHPRVYLAIEGAENQEIRCPYCGTFFRLEA